MLVMSIFTTPWGRLEVAHDEHFVFNASFTQKSGSPANSNLAHAIGAELEAYYADPHHRFQLQLKPKGSLYQLNVWNALLVIPVGRTLTYGELALKLQSSPRAIGQACKRNPLALFIPCHRVVGKDNLGGYMGNSESITYKEALLAHEAGI
ncbi:methylated-DNA--[protein]-cysteine S-methyltransferase [Legionella bononiensis]|uniref:Methylated-DNA--[protein]-cysteine S-methyltransferase n=1 Tax=Legionella bononiensis TaxID=2793102 RepID=A0ABS1W995_9GAMM|nr:methylated-DNA--[protein]-cysteine S-methyltransferase [Legionella bononiensis]MBL7480892.1 methylated-DNA--[protein]-cysteine S-methyltransferase [Legionella bononiensis]MBL7525926.1 methylated-DNA--[protein]-cysteine S-methyltransferase [Legionella bononiensis]MBL7564007.1 methylated-DNA--[protein]-cysteine S-methyltransferase [Legionella bononiensis]